MAQRLLLISNSTNYGEEYLQYPKNDIKNFLGDTVKKVLFIPFAGVTLTFDEYHNKVAKVFNELGYEVESIHQVKRPIEAVIKAEAIVVGGGNTFNLLDMIKKWGLEQPIREKVNNGTPYIGWSAGSNMACPTIKTTNDMPIVQPDNFCALNLIPFQINPHYTDAMPPNHGGETREQRLMEFLEANKDTYVVGLKEGTMLNIEGKSMKLIGNNNMRLFKHGEEIKEFDKNDSIDYLLDI